MEGSHPPQGCLFNKQTPEERECRWGERRLKPFSTCSFLLVQDKKAVGEKGLTYLNNVRSEFMWPFQLGHVCTVEESRYKLGAAGNPREAGTMHSPPHSFACESGDQGFGGWHLASTLGAFWPESSTRTETVRFHYKEALPRHCSCPGLQSTKDVSKEAEPVASAEIVSPPGSTWVLISQQ